MHCGSFLITLKALATDVTAWLSLRGKTSPAPGEDVTAGDKKGNLARERLRGRSTRENGIPERPQTLRYAENINNSSAEDGQSKAEAIAILDHFFFSCSSSPSRGVM